MAKKPLKWHARCLLFLTIFIVGMFIISTIKLIHKDKIIPSHMIYQQQNNYSKDVNSRRFPSNASNLSRVGLHLYPLITGEKLREEIVEQDTLNITQQTRNFSVLLWNHGQRMFRRFLRSFGLKIRDPFQYCSVNNCIFWTDNNLISSADAVFFHLHLTKGPNTLPQGSRSLNQRWIFFTDESPYNTFLATKKYKLSDYNDLFNWSMTYRSDSDIPVPYGRTEMLQDEERLNFTLVDFAAKKSKFVAILGSNCGGRNKRWTFVRQLQKYIKIDVYGGCGKLKCPGHFTRDCPAINDYKFYLSFENSNCEEYITEKLWWNAYAKEALPVVMGSSRRTYERLCPPESFIHTDDFDSPEQLANYLLYLDNNNTAYNEYFLWKQNYKIMNEHGYFGAPSLHLCRICEALNYNSDNIKIYNDLQRFWDSKTDCHSTKWRFN